MKAIQIDAFGRSVEVLKVVEVPDFGAPVAGEVVIALEQPDLYVNELRSVFGLPLFRKSIDDSRSK